MELKINGKLKLLMEQQNWDSGFSKREFVITTNEQYPQDIKMECIKDKIGLLEGIQIDEEIEVSFNLRGNEYNGRYFVNLQAWKILRSESLDASETTVPAPDFEPIGDEDDDLPF